MINRVTFLAIMFIFFNFSLVGQLRKSFSDDPAIFLEEFQEFMEKNISKEEEDFLDYFLEQWETDSVFFKDRFDGIQQVCNMLLKRKARPFPHFKTYLEGILAFKQSDFKENNYRTWEKGIITLLDNRRISLSKTNDYIATVTSIITERIIYKSRALEWRVSNKNYILNIQDDIPFIEFPDVDLCCQVKEDSINILKTHGTYNPIDRLWTGTEGMVSWERAGFKTHEVFAKLYRYEIDMTRSSYVADNVRFTNTFYFDHPLTGEFEDKVKKVNQPENATYPRFKSYTKKFMIKDFFEDIDYEGGFAMHGAKLIGVGSNVQKASLYIYSHDTLFLTASSTYFSFTSERAIGRNTEIKFTLKQDSIYHPDLIFTYNVNNREVALLKSEDYTSQGPYYNSYHQVDMTFDQLIWRFGEPFLTFTMSKGATIGNASFMSNNFFNMRFFESIQLHDDVHPLYLLNGCKNKLKSESFTGEQFAYFIKKPVHDARHLLMRMSFLGFIFYNTDTDEVMMKDRLYDYLRASVNKIDYDVIDFRSTTQAPLENASLDLNTFDLVINGMPRVFISDSQNVNIYPTGGRIILKRNRSFQFDGTVEAGLFTLWGNNFFFSYDSFDLNLQNIDSINLKFISDEVDGYGFKIPKNITSQIHHVTGEIKIDKSDNKSGREHYPEYPIFESRGPSYVYYDKKSIEGGVYTLDDFYFELEPFTIDSLDNFTYQGIAFDGILVSAGIFPDIIQTLRLQDDRSLGFLHTTPETGLPLYGDKGTYFDKLHLSNSGLRGNGKINYLTSTTKAVDFKFYPDSMNTDANEFDIARKVSGVQFPYLSSKSNFIHWLPYQDKWFTDQTEGPFVIYNDSTTLSGDILLEPTGLSAKGTMDLTSTVLKSNLFKYNAYDFSSDTTDYIQRSYFTDGNSFTTTNVKAEINYKTLQGKFAANNEEAEVEFPQNKYKGFMDYLVWKMDKQEVEMGRTKKRSVQSAYTNLTKSEDDQFGSLYYSTEKAQDSLNFISPVSVYNYNKNILDATGVKFVRVADAKIYPNKNELKVEASGKMAVLENCEILANTITQYHKFYKANASISSRMDYFGVGIYDYVDENGDIQNLRFTRIEVDSGYNTMATGPILEEDDFTLSPNYRYQGLISLNAKNKFLKFRGATQVVQNCNITPRWLKFECEINPDSIYIPLEGQSWDINGNRIFAGSMIASDSIHIFPTFFTTRKNYSDKYITTATNYLHFDRGTSKYKIASYEKLRNQDTTGNYISLHKDFCELYGEGKVDLNIDLGHVKLDCYGNTRHNVENNELKLDLVMGLTFHLRDDIVGIMANDVDSLPGLGATDITRKVYRKSLNEIMGVEETDKMFEELGLYGEIKELPKELLYTIFFTDLKLAWHDNSTSYRSYGQIGVGSVLGTQINKYVDGFVEIVRKRSGDKMDIYLKLDDKNWYYFGYTRGVMQTLSSNMNFVHLVKNLKNKERKYKVKGSRDSYNIIVSTDRKYRMFVRRWNDILEGVEVQTDDTEIIYDDDF